MSTLELSKKLGLTPLRCETETPLFYRNVSTHYRDTPCKLVKLSCEQPKIVTIELEGKMLDISLVHLVEMQNAHREEERQNNKAGATLRPAIGESIGYLPSSFCVLDLETTGFCSQYDDIIEFGILKVRNKEIIDSFSSLVHCESPLDPHITRMTGITNDMLENAPKLEEILPEVLDFIGDDIVVGHNVSFDIRFIYDKVSEILNKPFSNDYVCTMRFFKKLHPLLQHHRLSDMTSFYSVLNPNAHRALSDCQATFKSYLQIYDEVVETFGDAFLPISKRKIKTYVEQPASDVFVDVDSLNSHDNIFEGKQCVFTGTLRFASRSDASSIVSQLGGIVKDSVTKKTNYLILGNYDYVKSIKNGKSNKHKKAEELKEQGFDICVLPESVFLDSIMPFVKFGGNQ